MRGWFLFSPLLLMTGCANLVPSQPPARDITQVHDFGVTRIAFDPSGRRVASGGFLGGGGASGAGW